MTDGAYLNSLGPVAMPWREQVPAPENVRTLPVRRPIIG